MESALSFISLPLGKFLNLIYNSIAFGSYGLALIYFTIFIRLLLLPLTIKQYRSTGKIQQLQPQIQEIQKRYKNDKEKLNAELMKVYQENNVNPAGGCLPLLIQMPILFSLIYVIGKPLTYMLGYTTEKIAELLAQVPPAQQIGGYYSEIGIVNYHNVLNMKFLGLNLGLVPKWNPSEIFNSPMSGQYLALLILPVLAVVTTYFSIKLSTPKTADAPSSENTMANSMQRSMLFSMPLMTLFFSFTFPAGLGLYWVIGNIIQTIQQYYINKFVLKKKEAVVK